MITEKCVLHHFPGVNVKREIQSINFATMDKIFPDSNVVCQRISADETYFFGDFWEFDRKIRQ